MTAVETRVPGVPGVPPVIILKKLKKRSSIIGAMILFNDTCNNVVLNNNPGTHKNEVQVQEVKLILYDL